MAEQVDDSQINPIFLQQLQDALESDHEDQQDQRLGADDQLLFDSLRSIISGDNQEAQQQQNWNQVLDGNPDPTTLEAVQTALRELGGASDLQHGGWSSHRQQTEEDRDRIRNENRARKRKWRDTNISRNRDHDLRSRIVRRANIMFGDRESEEKHRWIEDEFHRRKERRFMKDPSDFHSMFRSSNNSLGESGSLVEVHTPRPPPFFTKLKAVGSVRIPVRIISNEARVMGKPLNIMALAKQIEKPPTPPPAPKPVADRPKPKKTIFEKFGLPDLPQNLAKLGPMPPLPKSILDHQRREKERLEKEREASESAAASAAASTAASAAPSPALGPVAAPEIPLPGQPLHPPTASTAPAAPSAPHTPSHATPHRTMSPVGALNDEELENIDDMLGDALNALGQGLGQEQETDPTSAIEELQAALAGQGLFE